MNPIPSSRPAGANIAIPSTIWLAPATAWPTPVSAAGPDADAVVPGWALRRIKAEFTRRPGQDTPAPLPHLTISGTGDGTDARARHQPDDTAPPSAPPVLLAELHPDATRTPHQPGANEGREDERPADFFYRAFRLLRTGGLLLTASRQAIAMTANSSTLRTAHRQRPRGGVRLPPAHPPHHATASGNRLHPTPNAPAEPSRPFWRHRPVHSDLLLFTPA